MHRHAFGSTMAIRIHPASAFTEDCVRFGPPAEAQLDFPLLTGRDPVVQTYSHARSARHQPHRQQSPDRSHGDTATPPRLPHVSTFHAGQGRAEGAITRWMNRYDAELFATGRSGVSSA
jgi:hypothetical protein